MPSLYDISIPVLRRSLQAQSELIKKGEAHAAEKGTPVSELIEARLYEDMAPLSGQVIFSVNTARGALNQLTGTELAILEKKDMSLAECHAVIDETIKSLADAKPESIKVKETDQLTLKLPSGDLPMSALAFVEEFAIPNAYFHLNMTYALLRTKGVPVGKLDYLKSFFATIKMG